MNCVYWQSYFRDIMAVLNAISTVMRDDHREPDQPIFDWSTLTDQSTRADQSENHRNSNVIRGLAGQQLLCVYISRKAGPRIKLPTR